MGIESKKISFHKQYISILIIILNFLIFIILDITTSQRIVVEDFAVIPSEIIEGRKALTIFTAMFVHINYLHIATNMFIFYVIGYKLEKEIGHILFSLTYFIAGICSFLLHITFNLFNTNLIDIRLFGASGAIFGVLGFYLILFFGKIYHNINLSHLFFYILLHIIFIYAVIVHIGGFIIDMIFAFVFKWLKRDYSKKDVKKTVTWSALGHAYFSNNMFTHALHYFEFAVKLNPHDVTNLLDLGFCYLTLENYHKANGVFKKILDVEPDNNVALTMLKIAEV
jgi:membrane associated rhomboid family serine protease